MLIIKELILKVLNVILGLVRFTVSYQVANSNQISHIAGSATAVMLPNGDYVVFFTYGFRTNTTRGNATAVFRIAVDGYLLEAVSPYFFPCTVNGAFGYSFGNNDGYWFNTSQQWNANTDHRISVVGLMRKTDMPI